MTCLSPGRLAELQAGQQPTPEEAAHLADCAACAAAGLEATVQPSLDATVTPAPSERPAVALMPGLHLGRYQLLVPLGEGGMGQVWSAYDPQLDRRIALKVLNAAQTTLGQDPLVREAQVMAKLSHPNVLTVFDVGAWPGGLFLAMEIAAGGTLDQWLAEKPRPWREVLALFLEVGRGLAAAHAAQVIHRDFKPANVVVSEGGRPRVMDFGLAHAPRESREEPSAPGVVMGTLAYMPPEQLRGEAVDARADQFSFCVALYEALFHNSPFDGDTWKTRSESLLAGRLKPPPRDTPVPAYVQAAVLRGLHARREERFESMDALLHALTFDPARRLRRALAGGAVALVAVLGVGLVLRQRAQERAFCPDRVQARSAAWNPSQQSQVTQALAALGDRGAAAAAQIQQLLGTFVSDWQARDLALCREVQSGHASHALTLQQDCLDRRWQTFATTLDMLDDAKVAGLSLAVREVENLPSPASCDPSTEPEKLDTPSPKLRALLARLSVLVDEGKNAEAATLVQGALALAKDEHSHAGQAEALIRQAELDIFLQANEALERADRALVLASEEADLARNDDLRAEALMDRILTLATPTLETVQARGAAARAALAHAGDPPTQLLLFNRAMADAVGRASLEGEAVPYARAALEQATRLFGPERFSTSWCYVTLGSALEGVDLNEALANTLHGIAIQERELGARDPVLSAALWQAAGEAGRLRHAAQALALAEQAEVIQRSSSDPNDSSVYKRFLNMGVHATLLENLGRLQDAVALYDQALALADQDDEVKGDDETLDSARLGKAACLLQLGQIEAAAALLRPLVGAVSTVEERGEPEFLLAQAEWALGHRDEAKALAAKALPLVSPHALMGRFVRADVAAWIQAHP